VLVKRHDKGDDRKKSRAASPVHVSDIHACGNLHSRVSPSDGGRGRGRGRGWARGGRLRARSGRQFFDDGGRYRERPLCENTSTNPARAKNVRVTFAFTIPLSLSLSLFLFLGIPLTKQPSRRYQTEVCPRRVN